MKIFLFCLLVGYAVRCDDTNYYVIEMPEEANISKKVGEDSSKLMKKPLKVYWNVPTMQCKSKKIPFEHLFEKYGILQNKNDSFRGEKITILYDPGLFPAILKNDSSGTLKFRNGGVPQGGDINEHLESFRQELDKSVPNPDFSGIGIIDFESWRPIFRQNFGVLVPYKDTSIEIERKLHWWWPEQWIKAEAKRRFEAAAREFMQTTVSVAKQMRPNALWGYYAFPYCFNMAKNGLHESCADGVPAENDRLYWLWSESSALFPSIYSSRDLSTSQLMGLVRGRMEEAKRVRRKDAPILPYFWFRYREGGYMSEVDLKSVLHTLYSSGATGFIIWGSSNDVNTKDKCINLHNYLDKTLGPNIAKYTKDTIYRDEENDVNSEIKDNNSTTTEKTNDVVELDPEFHWEPPENYTNNIIQNVEEEIRKKNTTLENQFSTQNTNESVLINLILNSIEKNDNSSNVVADNESQMILKTSHSTVSKFPSKNSKKGYPITDHGIQGFVYTTRGLYSSDQKISSTTASTNLNLNTTTESTYFIFTDRTSKTTTESSKFSTEDPNFDTITKNTKSNLDVDKNTESSKWLDGSIASEIGGQFSSSVSTEENRIIPIEDITENNIPFFNQETFFDSMDNTGTTESDSKSDITTNEITHSTLTKDFSTYDNNISTSDSADLTVEDISSDSDFITNISDSTKETTDSITNATDSTTNRNVEIDYFYSEDSSIESTTTVPNKVVVI